jgi:hypothetical protein
MEFQYGDRVELVEKLQGLDIGNRGTVVGALHSHDNSINQVIVKFDNTPPETPGYPIHLDQVKKV